MAEAMRTAMSSEHDSLVVEIRDLFRQLDRVAGRADRFGWDHPATATVLAAAEAAFMESLEPNPRTLRVEIRGDAFTVDEFDVWVPASPLEGAAASLLKAGIIAVEILPGVRGDELNAWLRAMMADRSSKLAPDDDVRTALWDAALAHVRFEIADEVDPDLVKRPVARTPTSQTIDRALRADMLQELVRESALPTAARLIDALTSEMANDTPEAHTQLRARVRAAAAGLIERGELGRLLEIHDAARERTNDPDEQRALTAKSIEAAIFEGDSFPAVLEVLRGSPREVRRFGRILERIDASRIGDVLAVLRLGAEGELRAILEKFVERAARGHEAEVARAIVDSPRSVAVRLLATLARVSTSAAAAEISRLAQHGDEDVRLDAKLLGASDPVRAVEDVVQMIDAPDAPTRFAAMRAIGRHDLQGAVFTLVRRLRAQSFVDLALDEKAELLRALLRLSPEQGESISLEILRTGGMFQSDAREATRLVAVELLGEHAVSNGALEALREVAKTHWGASRAMRDAAENAARALEDRLSKSGTGSQPPPSELRENPIESSGRLGARFVLPRADHRATYAVSLLDQVTPAEDVVSSSMIKRAAQTLAELSPADLATTANLLVLAGAQRHETRFAALVSTIAAGAIHQLGASMDVAAEVAFASLECEKARFVAKSSLSAAVVSSPSFGRLDEPASRRVILAVESLDDVSESATSIRSQVLATARRFVRALAGRSTSTPEDSAAVMAQLLERAETPREKLIVQLARSRARSAAQCDGARHARDHAVRSSARIHARSSVVRDARDHGAGWRASRRHFSRWSAGLRSAALRSTLVRGRSRGARPSPRRHEICILQGYRGRRGDRRFAYFNRRFVHCIGSRACVARSFAHRAHARTNCASSPRSSSARARRGIESHARRSQRHRRASTRRASAGASRCASRCARRRRHAHLRARGHATTFASGTTRRADRQSLALRDLTSLFAFPSASSDIARPKNRGAFPFS